MIEVDELEIISESENKFYRYLTIRKIILENG